MRTAYVCMDPGVPVFGRKGCSTHVQEMLRALGGQGATCQLFVAKVGGVTPPGCDGIPVTALSAPTEPNRAARERAALAANDDLRAALERECPFDLVYERYSLWSYAGMEFAQARGIPGLLEVNAPLIEEQAQYRGLEDAGETQRVAERAFGAATALLAVSRAVASYLEQYPQALGRVHVVPNGVDPARFHPMVAATCPAPAGTFTVGFVGSLKPWHGLSVLVEAFARIYNAEPRTRLLIVGDGPERPGLESDLGQRRLRQAATLTGAVAPSEVPGLLASMDVAVAPYPREDCYFSPLKVFEYMAAGLPVVTSRVGQLAEMLEHDVSALLCPPGDAVALAEAIERLRREPRLRARLGQAGRAVALRGYTWDGIARRILGLAGVGARPEPAVAESRS